MRRAASDAGTNATASKRGMVDVGSIYRSSTTARRKRAASQMGGATRDESDGVMSLSIRICAVLVVTTLLCVGTYVFSLVTMRAQETDWNSNKASQAVLERTVGCLVAAEAEWEQQMELAREPGDATAAAVTAAMSGSTEACGTSMLLAAPDLFRPILRNIGAVRNGASSAASAVSIARNYSSLAASLSGTIDRTTLAVPEQIRPSALFAEPLAALALLRVYITYAALLHLVGAITPGARESLASTAAALESQRRLLEHAPGDVSAVLQSPLMSSCLAVLRQPMSERGSAQPRDACFAVRDSLRVTVLQLVDELSDSIDHNVAQLVQWRWILLAAMIAVVLVLAYGAAVVVLAQRQSTTELEAEIATRRKITESVQAFVPAQFLVILGLRVITEVVVDDPKHVDVTMLASDIRSFTTISEMMTDIELFAWLQEHLANMTAATRRAGGFIEKYIGDAVVCVFEEPADAIRCGIDMQYVVAEANVTRGTRGEEHMVRVGVGIHSGPTHIGILGDETVQNTAVVGRSVDIAAKLEELTKVYGAKIIVTQDTFEAAGLELSDHRKLGEVKVDRLQLRIVEIYSTEQQDVREYKTATRSDFEAAVLARDRGNISAANAHFDAVLKARKPLGYSDLAAVKVIEM